MKKISNIITILLLLSVYVNAVTVYEDAEDGKADRWVLVGDGNDAVNVYSHSSDSRVIHLDGQGGPWRLKAPNGDFLWKNTTEKTISWRMSTSDRYTVFITVSTTFGTRYLFYNDLPKRILRHNMDGKGILHGLGGYKHDSYKGVWRKYTRDLEADLKDSEPDNEIISIDGFMYSGSDAFIDDIVLYNPQEHVYEDGSGAANWVVADNDPAGATITSINDPFGEHVHGDVLQFQGDGMNNSYKININESEYDILQWRSRYYENYSVSVMVETTEGTRELLYRNYTNWTPTGGIKNDGQTIWIQMGNYALVGVNGWEQKRDFGEVNHHWQTVTRDLRQDIKSFEPDNELISVTSFTVIGGSAIEGKISGLFDGIRMLSRPDTSSNQVGPIVQEDAEDNTTNGWSVYSNISGNAIIKNVEDNITNSRVIELDGENASDGFMLGNISGSQRWRDTHNNSIKWSMKYNQDFIIYLSVDTTNGHRYIIYSPRDDTRGLNGEYIRIGIGADTTKGEWRTFIRNISDDINNSEAGNELVSIDAFLIRGSGRLDNIETFTSESYSGNNVVHDDAENGDTVGWRVYANTSGQATVANVEDNTRGGRVIKLIGQDIYDGFMLGNITGGQMWDDKDNNSIKWSMNYTNSFIIYISVETTNGHRYIVYTARDDDRGLNGEYIRLGLGADANNGTWKTFTRNLASDIEGAEAGNELISIDAFLIKGSGLVDDIETLQQ